MNIVTECKLLGRLEDLLWTVHLIEVSRVSINRVMEDRRRDMS